MNFSSILSFILRFRVSILLVLGLLVLGGLAQTARHLTVNNSLSIWFLDNNPKYQAYLAFQKTQGSDQIVVAMLAVDSLYAPTDFEKMTRLHTALDSLPFVSTTLSLANLKYPLYTNKKIVYRDFYGLDRSVDWMNGLLKDLPNVRRQLISEDGNHIFFYCQLAPGDVIEQDRRVYVHQIETLIRTTVGPVRITGPPIINEAYSQTIYEESSFFAATTVIVIVLLLLFLLPHWMYLPIALATVAVTVGITLGLLTSFGYSLNLISMLIPTILMVYAISDTIHIINIFHAHRNAHPEQDQTTQLTQALKSSLKPCFYTTLTTVVGYLALSLSPLPAFRVTGLFTFLGILIAFLSAYLITAIGFSYLPKEPLKGRVKKINIQGLVAHINRWTGQYNTHILVSAVVIFILGIVGLFFIDVNTNSLHLLGKGSVKDDLQRIEQTLQGSARLQLTVNRLDDQNILGRSDLNKVQAFQDSLSQIGLLAHPISILDFQQFMEARLSSLARLQPIDLKKVLTNSESNGNTMFSLVSDDYTELSVNINIRELQTKELEQLLSSIKRSFQQTFSTADYQLTINGFPAVYAQLNRFILQTQFRSFGAAFIVAFCILFYFLGDLKTTILALIPNLLPLCITILLMWLLGIDLEAANAMLAPIMIGVSMDDTIHLMNKYQLNRQTGMPVGESIDQALAYTGGALLSTTIALVCGFLVVGLSGVISVATFGLLCAFTILVALIADIVVLPALFKRFR